MTKTVFVTNINEIKHLKVTCKSCGYAMQLPINSPFSGNVQVCPTCNAKYSLEDIKKFVNSIKALRETLRANENYSNLIIEIETEEKE